MGEKFSPDIKFQSTKELLENDLESPVDVVVVAGAIKWFDVAKGFGFIVPDGDLPDVLLHVACLRQDGFQTAYEGARVVCEVVSRERGWQAWRGLSMDDSIIYGSGNGRYVFLGDMVDLVEGRNITNTGIH